MYYGVNSRIIKTSNIRWIREDIKIMSSNPTFQQQPIRNLKINIFLAKSQLPFRFWFWSKICESLNPLFWLLRDGVVHGGWADSMRCPFVWSDPLIAHVQAAPPRWQEQLPALQRQLAGFGHDSDDPFQIIYQADEDGREEGKEGEVGRGRTGDLELRRQAHLHNVAATIGSDDVDVNVLAGEQAAGFHPLGLAET